MTFETARLYLRPWREEDAEDLYAFAKDPLVGPIAGWLPHRGVENSRTIIRTVLSEKDTYALVSKENGRAIGSIGLSRPSITQGDVGADALEIGYWIGVPYWGQGLMPEAVQRLMSYAFQELGCTELWCGYFQGNERSRRVQEKCGFRYHHTEKDINIPLLGELRDEHFTCITKKEWEAMQ